MGHHLPGSPGPAAERTPPVGAKSQRHPVLRTPYRGPPAARIPAGGEGHASDCTPDAGDHAALPDTRIGLAFVYRVFNRVAYALVMKSAEQIAQGDSARNP